MGWIIDILARYVISLGNTVCVRGIVLNAKIAAVNIFYMSPGNLSSTICCTQQLNMKYIINHFGSCCFFQLFRPISLYIFQYLFSSLFRLVKCSFIFICLHFISLYFSFFLPWRAIVVKFCGRKRSFPFFFYLMPWLRLFGVFQLETRIYREPKTISTKLQSSIRIFRWTLFSHSARTPFPLSNETNKKKPAGLKRNTTCTFFLT